jgi:predicted nucleic acid-binding protein
VILPDSSVWITIFTNGPRAHTLAKRILNADRVIVPTVILYEVSRVMSRLGSEETVSQALLEMQTRELVDLDAQLALEAADLGIGHRLAMADAIIYATARAHDATLITSDQHFEGLPGVEYLPAD